MELIMRLTDGQLLHNYNRGIKPTTEEDEKRVKRMLALMEKFK